MVDSITTPRSRLERPEPKNREAYIMIFTYPWLQWIASQDGYIR